MFMTVVRLFTAWQQAIQFDTPSLVVREIDPRDTKPLLKFIEDNRDEIARYSPTYKQEYGGDLNEGRVLSHIMDWRLGKEMEGNATLVCYDKEDTKQSNLVATMTIDHIAERADLLELGLHRDKNLRGRGFAAEAISGLTTKIAFDRLRMGGVRVYPEPDDRDGCGIAERAGFSFCGYMDRPLPFFNAFLQRRYAVYERTPS
jgi:RimJ/RimL family protein N-acetyltransferase